MTFVLRGLLVDLWCIYVSSLIPSCDYVPQYSTYAILAVNGVTNDLSSTLYRFYAFWYVQTSLYSLSFL